MSSGRAINAGFPETHNDGYLWSPLGFRGGLDVGRQTPGPILTRQTGTSRRRKIEPGKPRDRRLDVQDLAPRSDRIDA
jgi:hypothetical protein